MGTEKSEALPGTLDLMILKTLPALGPQHGFGIARRIEQGGSRCSDTERGNCITAATLDCG
jgi:hypothetical protein